MDWVLLVMTEDRKKLLQTRKQQCSCILISISKWAYVPFGGISNHEQIKSSVTGGYLLASNQIPAIASR